MATKDTRAPAAAAATPAAAAPATPDNEIRVATQGSQRWYITTAIGLLRGDEGKPKTDSVTLRGMGSAIFNVVNVAEIVKRRVVGVHQTTELGSHAVTGDGEAGTVERKVPTIAVTLATKAGDTKNIGYQAPLPETEVTAEDPERDGAPRGGRGRGRGRGFGGFRGRGAFRGTGERRDDRREGAPRGGASGRGGWRGGDDGGARGGWRGGRGGDDGGARGGWRGGRGAGGRGGRGGRGAGGGRGRGAQA